MVSMVVLRAEGGCVDAVACAGLDGGWHFVLVLGVSGEGCLAHMGAVGVWLPGGVGVGVVDVL